MFNPLNLITKFIKSSNQKELDRIGKIVDKINSHEEDFKNLNDDDFPKKTNEFRNCLLYTSPSPRDRTRSRMPSSA